MKIVKDLYKLATGALFALVLTWLLAPSSNVATPLMIASMVWLLSLLTKAYFMLRDEKASARG